MSTDSLRLCLVTAAWIVLFTIFVVIMPNDCAGQVPDSIPRDACTVLIINNLPGGPPLVVAIRQGEYEAVFEEQPVAPGQYLRIQVDCDVPELHLWVANYFDRRQPVYRRATTPPRGQTSVWCFGPCPFEPRRGTGNESRQRKGKGASPPEMGGRQDARDLRLVSAGR